ncbi:MAG: hydantoinase B/oxoprolinase family protein [Cupriavidus sp.]|nr:hydantoinase B/oxoprolinase family protein [Cupriavidus sp.]
MKLTDYSGDLMVARGIGYEGKPIAQALEDSEQIFRQTGCYQGVRELPLKSADPIRFEKIASRLRGALVGARETALNISASPIVREIGELCFGLYTPEGDSVTLSTGIMAHIHTMSEAIKHMVRSGYETNPGIADGDIFINNDPHIGDVHTADVQQFVPIFWQGELIAWAAGVTHELDVGAAQPSGMPMGSTTRFEDGWILSCEKVGSKDELRRDYQYRSQTATRMPFYWVLDEKCRIAGCHLVRKAVLSLVEAEGIDTFRQFCREAIEDTRRSFVTRMKSMTVPGTYRFGSFIDLNHSVDVGRMPEHAAVDTLIHAPLELKIGAEGSFDISLEGASKWGYHSFNATPTAMQAGLWVALTQTLIPNDKVNDGAYLATRLSIPHGSLGDPDNPYCSNTLAWGYMVPTYTGLMRALGTAFASRGYVEEVLSGIPLTGNVTQGGGVSHYGQEMAWSNFEMSCVGISAGYVKDGEHSCAAMWNPEGDMGDVEAWELIEPLMYLGRRLRPSTAGMGKYRGGSGWESVRMLHGTQRQELYNLINSRVFCSGGLFGGYPASNPYRHNVKRTDLKERFAKQLPYPVADGNPEESGIQANVSGEHLRDHLMNRLSDTYEEYDLYLSVLLGGHGLGDVIERDPTKVADDLNEGLLLPRFALSAYGVVATQGDDGKWRVDGDATHVRREAIRKNRLARSVPVTEWIAQQRPRVEKCDFIEPVRRMHRESCELSKKWRSEYVEFWGLQQDWNA